MPPIAYFNGQDVDAKHVSIPVTDWGFLQGITLSEQLRTFRGEPFELDAHLDRLFASIRYLEWCDAPDRDDLTDAVRRIASHNWQLIDEEDDLGITVFATPGTYPLYADERENRGTVCVHTYPLPFHAWCRAYEQGQHLVPVRVRQVSEQSWPTHIKCRSRMHYYLAAREAQAIAPGAIALLKHEDGRVSETPTANVVAHFPAEGLVTPPAKASLPGISLAYVRKLAIAAQIPFVERDLSLEELRQADAILLTSTPYSILPVSRFEQQAMPCPGRIYQHLLSVWNQHVGIDHSQQAMKFAAR